MPQLSIARFARVPCSRGREHVRGLTPREAGQRSTPARHVPRRSLSDGSSEAGSSRSVASSSTTKPSGTGSLLLSASRYTTRWLHVGGLDRTRLRVARHGDEEARLACGRGVRPFMSEAQRTDVRCVQIACTMSAQCGDVKALLPSSKEPCRPQHSHLTTTAESKARKCEVADGAPASRRSWHRCDACPSPRTRALRREHVDCFRPFVPTGVCGVSCALVR